MNKYLSKCCNAEKKVYHGGEGTSHFQCSACGKEFIPKECTAVNQATDIEKLVAEAIYQVSDECDEELMRKYIKKAYALGYDARRSEI